MVTLKRIYEPYGKGDGFRILVDRLWPRGVSKEKAKINLWLKDIGPSNELRKWFNHEVEKWPEFKKRYKQELKSKKELVEELRSAHRKHKTITLLYAAKDEKRNEAIIIKDLL
ncbi:MAG TPA: DUF488 family protein [Candidatus Colwellbacteria bacterium]|nr:DUF488 family protein [Candidatus Colwellbacteria bacterium]